MKDISDCDINRSRNSKSGSKSKWIYNMLEMEKEEVDKVQFSALLGSTRLLRKVLDISG